MVDGGKFFCRFGVFPLYFIILHQIMLLTTHAAVPTSSFTCNFDRSWCEWSNSARHEDLDDFNWKRGTGGAGKQRGSGANDDHGGGGGYLYIKSKNRGNRTAKLFSSRFSLGEDAACFQFWYFMKGRNLGHLKVLLANSRQGSATKSKVLWNLWGHQANRWKIAKVPLPRGTSGVIIIEAFDMRRGRSGNILIDDTAMMSQGSQCRTVQPPYAAPPTSTTSPSYNPTTERTAIFNFTTSFNNISSTVTSYSIYRTISQISTETSTVNSFTDVVKNAASSKSNTVGTDSAMTYENTNSNQTASERGITLQSAAKPGGVIAAIVLSVVFVLIALSVAIVIFLKWRKKQQSGITDNCSVVMTRMYPDLATEPSIDYRKFT